MDELQRSMVEEREMLLARLKAYRAAIEHMVNVAILATGQQGKNEALLEIAHLGDEALTL